MADEQPISVVDEYWFDQPFCFAEHPTESGALCTRDRDHEGDHDHTAALGCSRPDCHATIWPQS